jgi:hypothetical protein
MQMDMNIAKTALQQREFQAQHQLAQRKQAFLERQFAASEQERSAQNEAIKRLSGYTIDNIDQAPGDVLTTIDKGAVRSMISAWTAKQRVLQSNDPKAPKLPSKDIQVMREIEKQMTAMEEELGRPVSYEETPFWKIFFDPQRGKAKKVMSEEEIRLEVFKQFSKDDMWKLLRRRDPAAANQQVEEAIQQFFKTGEPGVIDETGGAGVGSQGPAEQGGATLQNVLERFKAERGR